MALSLVCKQCGAQLRSVAEAQAHGEASGHSQFEESTAAVLALVCADCGKPCRSQTEQDLHTKFTGHATFVDKTSEAAKALDTEAEMRAASVRLAEDVGAPSTSAPAAAGEAGDLAPPTVDVALRQQLEDMGFSANRATRALHFSGGENIEAAINWIMEHESDADLDLPLLVPKEAVKPKLSPEEARQAAEEMVRKARERREREEAEAEKLREKERIRAGKELLLAKRQEDELRLKRNIEERRREKEEERRAREKIRAKLEEDRRERRRRLGLPEEPTEEEKAAEAAAASKPAPDKPKAPLFVKPVTEAERMRAVLVQMKKQHAGQDERVKTAWATLLKYVGNIARDPREEKFRKIRLSNAAFQSRCGSVEGSIAFLELCGFQKDASGEFLELSTEQTSLGVLNAAGGELNGALTNPFFGAL